MKTLITAITILILLPTLASATIYRCNIGGQIIFTDQPCNYDAPVHMESTRSQAPTEQISLQAPAEPTIRPQESTPVPTAQKLLHLEKEYFVLHDEVGRMERQHQALDSEYQNELNKIKNKQRRAANNLAGATWLSSLAQEMQAVTARYAPRLDRMQNDIDRKKNERDTLKNEIDTIKRLR